jgi:hypothetical protein
VEGACLSTAGEELPTVLYEIGQASDPADVPCKIGAQSQIAIHKSRCNQASNILKESSRTKSGLIAGRIQKFATNTK